MKVTFREIRKQAGFKTQDALALKLGIERAAIAKWETGVCFPKTQIIPKIAHLLNTTEGEVIASINATKESNKTSA